MPKIIDSNHFFEKFNERVGPLDRDDLVKIIEATPIEERIDSFDWRSTFYVRVKLKEEDYFIVCRYDNNDLVLVSILNEEIFLDIQRRNFVNWIYKSIPQTKFKRIVQTQGSYRRDPFAKTKDGRFSEEYK